MNSRETQEAIHALKKRHPLWWAEMSVEQKKVALANALSLEPKVLDRAFRLARYESIAMDERPQEIEKAVSANGHNSL